MPDWYYARDGQQCGPVTFDQLRSLCATGQVGAKDLVWTEGMPQWQTSSEISALLPVAQPIPYPTAPTGTPVAATMAPTPYGYTATTPSYYPPYSQPQSKHMGLALTGMILSLVSIMMCIYGIPLAIAGAICGGIALKGMKVSGDFRQKGFALTGLWVGIGLTAIYLVIILIYVIAIAVAVTHR